MSTFPYVERTQTDPYDDTKMNAADMNYLLGTSTVYRALMTSNGSSDPDITVLENTTGLTFTSLRFSAGYYLLNITGGTLDEQKTMILFGVTKFVNTTISCDIDPTFISITVSDSAGSPIENKLIYTPIEVRIYP